jgi:hypothetical protein
MVTSDILFGADYEERGAQSEHIQAFKIDVATIHDIECTLPSVMPNKRWYIAAQVEQSIPLAAALCRRNFARDLEKSFDSKNPGFPASY